MNTTDQTKHSYFPIPWSEDCDGDIRDAKGKEVDWAQGMPHALDCVNGTDPRTKALVEALEESIKFFTVVCPGSHARDTTLRKMNAALALAKGDV